MSKKIKEYSGTALSKDDIREGRVLSTLWRPNAKYGWAAGVAISRYLNELKNGRIIGRKCNKCGRVVVPPRMFCEWCFKPTDGWVYLKDTGKVNTYAISYIAADTTRIKEPIIPAVIEIDGASKGMGIFHLLGEVDPKNVKIGMRVRAQWKPPGERTGAITDIKYFKPI
ncbi:MAG: Zn-ribbon domain-containing OB-fold protein [Candidatus Geothermarchaeales archaeon]